ncbi:PAQR family membrane homeostasis protein TrhA [Holzapfeliella sp. JNUCC 80]
MELKKLFQKPEHVSKSYNILNEVFGAVTHGIGVLLSIAGLVLLIIKAAQTGDPLRIVSFIVYGCSLLTLYLCSTLYHSLSFTRARHVFRIFDHSAIFILIAGSYTPYTLVAIGGAKGWWMFGAVWFLAIFGIIYKIFNLSKHKIIDVLLYIGLGWVVLLSGSDLYYRLGTTGFWLLLLGGITYTVGALIYSMRGIPFIHVIWHVFVMIASILMYFSILFYV